MRIDLGKTKVRHGRRLKLTDGVGQTNFAGAKLFKEFDGVCGCHKFFAKYTNGPPGHA
jgi:hypothetical protein